MQLGIVGLPNAGKSTLFNLVTGGAARTDLYPFTTVDSNVGTVEVPDERLDQVARALGSRQSVPSTVRIVDIAGLVPGASRGEGLGNRFLGHIREVDAVAHVVRAFQREDVPHSEGDINPLRDLELVELEMILADLETVQRRIESIATAARSGDRVLAEQMKVLSDLKQRLTAGQYLATSDLSSEEERAAADLHLLTWRPVLCVANVDESEMEQFLAGASSRLDPLRERASERGMKFTVIPLGFEQELSTLAEGERQEFLQDLGLQQSGRERFLRAAHELLGLITFFTGNAKETQARSLRRGATAVEAAGKIHSDMERGFIRVEVINADELLPVGSRREARDRGLLRIEGRDYLVSDGDVMEVLFRV